MRQVAGGEPIITGSWFQRWAFDHTGRVAFLNSQGKCLDVGDGTARIQPCSTATDQKWINLREWPGLPGQAWGCSSSMGWGCT